MDVDSSWYVRWLFKSTCLYIEDEFRSTVCIEIYKRRLDWIGSGRSQIIELNQIVVYSMNVVTDDTKAIGGEI